MPWKAKWMLWTTALAACSGGGLFAQDLTGTWPGTLQAAKQLRTVIKVAKGDDGGLSAVLYSIDQGARGYAGVLTVQGSNVKMSFPGLGGKYEGKLDSDGVIITGNFAQGPKPLALNLRHVTSEMAWEIRPLVAKQSPMAADAHLAFEVATIKPSNPDKPQGKRILMQPHRFSTTSMSLNDLITYAYGIHARQIVGGANWMASDRWDILAEPEAQGAPNRAQLKTMVQSLLADRFQLAFHHDTKELSVYAIVVAKNGPKLVKSAGDPNGLPGMFFRGLGNLPATNASMAELASLMQEAVLDRPVIDQTGISGKFDLELRWTPDETQFEGHGANVRRDAPDAPPDLFTAFQQQLGLQLKPIRAAVDVLVIDRVERPSEN
jgi:uncharacterized protein (TIGR03435 family)